MGDWVRRRKHAGGAAVGCAVALAVSQGCGTADRPSAFGSSIAARAEAGPAQTIDIDASSTYEPMCNLGPEGGVCACVDEPLAGDVPNLYFVLDRSGSMAEMGKWSNVQIALDQLVVALGPRANIGAAVFPDPSNGACSTGVEVMPTRRGDAPAGKRGTTDAILVTTLSRIPAAGGTPTAATLASLVPKLAALPGQTYVVLATDGGPNCNAFAACDATTCTYNIDDVTDCPPGGPPNCCTDPGTGPEACLDSEPTIQAVAELAAAGIPVYVIGVPGSAPYADLLDALAVTGGTARGGPANVDASDGDAASDSADASDGGAARYYAIDTADQSALLAVLASIAAQITGTCTLDLSSVPPDSNLVNVFLDESVLPQNGPDGWTLDGSTVTISGASCQEILEGAVLDVRVVAGCPTVAH